MDSSIFVVLENILPYCKSIWNYDSAMKSWLKYIPGYPYYLNDLQFIEYGKGYWIQVSQDVIFNVIGNFIEYKRIFLYPGWNFVGFNSTVPLTVEQALSSLDYKSICTYNNDEIRKQWERQMPGAPTFLNKMSKLESGKGYGIYVDKTCLWQIP